MKIAQTIAEAEAQFLALPNKSDDKEWRHLARLIDGYSIAKELGFDLMTWGNIQENTYEHCGYWNLSLLELRLMLFYEFRADYMSGYTYHERDHLVDSLLVALSEKTGQYYESMKS